MHELVWLRMQAWRLAEECVYSKQDKELNRLVLEHLLSLIRKLELLTGQ